MPKKIRLQGHLTTEELERRYKQAKDGVERSQYQIIWMLSQWWSTTEVMAATGYSRGWAEV